MDQLICAFLSHTHNYWYDVGMLKVPGLQIDGKLENAGKRRPGGRRKKSGRTAWQMIFGCLASRGTEEPPHLTLGRGITRYTEGIVGFMAAWVREEENTSNQRQKKREAEEADKVWLRLHLG